MKKNNLKGGFAPLLIIAIVAILAIGGGTYAVIKNKQKAQLEDNLETQANVNADVNANANANLGVDANAKARTSLRSLLALGKNTMCTFTSTNNNVSSSGTVYLGADGDMYGNFESKTSTNTTVSSHMITKDGITYAWSGTQGVKMDITGIDVNANTEMQAAKYADLDAQGDYNCSAWVRDDSKFTLPTDVTFTDLNALLKLNTGIKY